MEYLGLSSFCLGAVGEMRWFWKKMLKSSGLRLDCNISSCASVTLFSGEGARGDVTSRGDKDRGDCCRGDCCRGDCCRGDILPLLLPALLGDPDRSRRADGGGSTTLCDHCRVLSALRALSDPEGAALLAVAVEVAITVDIVRGWRHPNRGPFRADDDACLGALRPYVL